MKCFSEETRRKMSESAKKRCTKEWRKRQSERLSTPLNTDLIKEMYYGGMTQGEIADELGVSQKVIWKHMKNHNIKTRKAAKRNQYLSANHMWKGNDASYKAFHQRLKSHFGSAKSLGCSVCGTHEDSVWYDWANLTGNYGDLNDYAPMCRSCHRQYDKKKRGKKGGDAI